MKEGILDLFKSFGNDIKILNENCQELQQSMNMIIDEHNKLVTKSENYERGLQLIEVRANKLELVITKIQQQIPKIKSYDYLPIPKVKSGTNI